MFNASEPLGLPRGSVRAILALMVTGVTLYITASTGQIPTDLGLIATTIVGWYFGTRATETAGTETTENPPAPEDI